MNFKHLSPEDYDFCFSFSSSELVLLTYIDKVDKHSYHRYCTGTNYNLQLRLYNTGSAYKRKKHLFLFDDISLHQPPLQASSSPIPRS